MKMVNSAYSKYLDQKVFVKIDRPLNSKHPKHGYVYELNYGFVPDTVRRMVKKLMHTC